MAGGLYDFFFLGTMISAERGSILGGQDYSMLPTASMTTSLCNCVSIVFSLGGHGAGFFSFTGEGLSTLGYGSSLSNMVSSWLFLCDAIRFFN